MNISNIVGALFPIFFVLALGYLAGKRHTFDADQAAGFSKLALSFALPASLFVSMTGIPRDLLLGQGRLVLALILSHVGLFVIAWIALKQIASLRGTPAIIYSLMLATSATPVFGLAVLEPILGASSAGAVALVALAINVTVPLAIVLLEMDAAALAPDLLAKVAFEPGWGHFEIKALGRFFRDRIASTATTNGHTNTTEGYGVGFGALMPFVNRRLDVSLEGLLGQGIGRYGSSGLPDATINPTTGALRPLREARFIAGLVYHHTSRLDLYTYGGDEYAGRDAFVSPTGTAAGYGSPPVS